MSADYKLETAIAAVAKARKAWDASTKAWSREDHTDATRAMMVGEAMMYAATDLISAQEDLAEALKVQAEELEAQKGRCCLCC